MARTEEKGTARTAATKRQRAAPAAGEGEPAGALPRRRAPRRDQASEARMGRNATAPAPNMGTEAPGSNAVEAAKSYKQPKMRGTKLIDRDAASTADAVNDGRRKAPPVPAANRMQTRPGAAAANAGEYQCGVCSETAGSAVAVRLCEGCYEIRSRFRACQKGEESTGKAKTPARRTAMTPAACAVSGSEQAGLRRSTRGQPTVLASASASRTPAPAPQPQPQPQPQRRLTRSQGSPSADTAPEASGSHAAAARRMSILLDDRAAMAAPGKSKKKPRLLAPSAAAARGGTVPVAARAAPTRSRPAGSGTRVPAAQANTRVGSARGSSSRAGEDPCEHCLGRAERTVYLCQSCYDGHRRQCRTSN